MYIFSTCIASFLQASQNIKHLDKAAHMIIRAFIFKVRYTEIDLHIEKFISVLSFDTHI